MIQTLPKSLANQIAAGEVVERPLSVVKELVENSLDAGANTIFVEIRSGGLDYICVQDDGEGMTMGDLSILGEKHSTSKIHSLEDLFHILTFGFRGEALASISSVSKVRITSKHRGDTQAFSKSIIGGESTEVVKDVLDVGTKIEVQDLFFNTPARRNYLKSEKTEAAHIREFLSHMSLVYPEVRFSYFQDGKETFIFPQSDTFQRVYQVFGEDFYTQHLELTGGFSGGNITGLISNPKIHFGNKQRQIIFVNRRLIKSPIISKAIYDAYNRFIPHGTFPAYVLHIEIDPTIIDVNVHPKKMEIRFANEQDIYRSVYHSILSTLEKSTLFQPSSIGEKTKMSEPSQSPKYFVSSGTKFAAYSPYKDIQMHPAQEVLNFFTPTEDVAHTVIQENGVTPDLSSTPHGKIIGQVFRSYILIQDQETLIFFDQHALAERIIFERLSAKGYIPKTQKILVPLYLDISSTQKDFLEQNFSTFSDMGFEIEILSGNAIHILGVPDFVDISLTQEVIEGIFQDISVNKKKFSNSLQEVRNKMWAYTACRSAIKFGHTLSMFEMKALLQQSIESYTSTCPHGRPVVFQIHKDDLKGKFDR